MGLIEEAMQAIDGYIGVLRRQKHWPFIYKELLAKVVLLLHANQDTVRAQGVLDAGGDFEGWMASRECSVGYDLVEAFRTNDGEKAEALVKDQIFSFLQVEVARAA